MRLTAAVLASDAIRLFRRDAGVLLSVAGPFWFLPALTVALLVPPPPRPAGAGQTEAYTRAVGQWMAAQGPWYLLDFAAGLWGAAVIYLLYSGRGLTVAEAIRAGATLWLRLLLASAIVGAALLPLAMILAALPGAIGLLPWTFLALFVFGRLLPIGPALATERPLSATGAIGRAWRLTRGAWGPPVILTAAILGLGWIASQPFVLADGWVRAQAGGNPVAIALLNIGAAAVSSAAALASALVAVACYRRLAR